MSDNRRRRESHQSGSSDDSDSYDGGTVYDTAGSDSDAESQDKNRRESGDGQEEEEKPQKKLDDDEDRRNPQYIPKRGTFYEHDDRTADEINNETAEAQPERDAKEKKVWKDKEDRWNHDRYNDEEQAPKSHAELIAVYGYDIRNEEGPPRARRRRRYGRGPNKYTRNWEDEDAYGKVTGNVITQKPAIRKINRTDEEFPLLSSKDNDISAKIQQQPVITSAWYSNKNKVHNNKVQAFPSLQQTDGQKSKSKQFINSQINENKAPNERNNLSWKKESKNTEYIQNANEASVASNETEKIIIVKNTSREYKKIPQVQESVSLLASKSRGRGFKVNTNNNVVGSRTTEVKPKGRGLGPINIDSRKSNIEHEQVVNDMKHVNVSTEGASYYHAARQNKHFYTQSSNQHSTVIPSRIQSHPQQQQPPQQSTQTSPQQDISNNRPKRYSSLRQRPTLAEGPPNPPQQNYQPAAPHNYYPPPPHAGSSRAVLESPGYPPGPYEQSPALPSPASPMTGQSVIPIPPGAQPTTYAPHAPPPFLVPPPQFIAPQAAPPSIINYVAGPNGPIFQPNYQGYNPAAVQPGPPPPQDVGLYQPQGCTYYSPAQQQQQQQQPVPLRRPKAAIPILPPPDNPQNHNNRNRNRSQQQSQSPSQSHDQQQQIQQQIQQQQQQQEQMVQQQLQQHQQQLIEEQKQEQKQLEKVIQQHQQNQYNSNHNIYETVERTAIDTFSKMDSAVALELYESINRQTNLDEKIRDATSSEEKPVIVDDHQSLESSMLETEMEKKEVSLSNIETDISNITIKVIENKPTETVEILTAKTFNEERKTDIIALDCAIENITSEANHATQEILIETDGFANSKNKTDCSVNESTVIEEAAA